MNKKNKLFIICFCCVLILSLLFINNSFSKYSFNSELSFKVSPDAYNTEFLEHTYKIYSLDEKIPVVISNNNNYDISGNITFNGTTLVESFTILANTKYEIINVSLTSDIYDSLVEGETYYLDINMTGPYSHCYSNKVSFIKQRASISIKSVTSSLGDNISYTEDTIAINNNLDSSNTSVTYTITLKNNEKYIDYKFRNITDVVDSNTGISYTTNINLGDGVFINRDEEFSFDITYTYKSSLKDNSNRQIIYFDFKEEYIFGGVTDKLIAIGTPFYAQDDLYGDFGVLEPGDPLGSEHCTYNGCYSDNGGNFVYDSDGGLVLDTNNPIATLNIDQSMSVEDEYSIYVTLKADTSQQGLPSGSFPGTVLAVSEANTKYLLWFGFYKNYLHIYSYYNGTAVSNLNSPSVRNGFISIDVSEYSNKIMNIQISAVRGGITNVYINGSLVQSFNSGTNKVSYKSATIGDLRPGRALKFQGTIYDMIFYNKAISEEEIAQNWEYSKGTWNYE